MRGRLWLKCFIKACRELEDHCSSITTDREWTAFMKEVMDKVAGKMYCYNVRRQEAQEKRNESCEYLNIDCFFFDLTEYRLLKRGDQNEDPLVLPRAVVELENNPDRNKIAYCLWKLFCIRSTIRCLICYQDNPENVTSLKRHLEDVIWKGSLMKGSDGDVLVIIGDGSRPEDCEWKDYFNVFEWRNDRLEKLESMDW